MQEVKQLLGAPPKKAVVFPFYIIIILSCALFLAGVWLWLFSEEVEREKYVNTGQGHIKTAQAYLQYTREGHTLWLQTAMAELAGKSKKETLAWAPHNFQLQGSMSWFFLLSKNGEIIRSVPVHEKSHNDQMIEVLAENTSLIQHVVEAGKSLQPQHTFIWLTDRLYSATYGAVGQGYAAHVLLLVPVDVLWLRTMRQATGVEVGLVSASKIRAVKSGMQHTGKSSYFGVMDAESLGKKMTPGHFSSLQIKISGTGFTPVAGLVVDDAQQSPQAMLLLTEAVFAKGVHAKAFLAACVLAALGSLAFLWGCYNLFAQSKKEILSLPDAIAKKNQAALSETGQAAVSAPVHDTSCFQSTPPFEAAVHLYQRFFDNGQDGMFLCTTEGKLLQANARFATQLGYDSVSHLLSRNGGFFDFCVDKHAMQEILTGMQLVPGKRYKLTCISAAGKPRLFWLVGVANAVQHDLIEGFLIDRTLYNRLCGLEEKYNTLVLEKANLSVLLASFTWQARYFFLSREERCESKGALLSKTPLSPGQERRVSNIALESIFEDVYQLAMHEAEGKNFNSALHLRRLLEETQSQVTPAILRKKLRFACVIAEDAPEYIFSFGPLLRYCLLRFVFFMSQYSKGGEITLFVEMDKEQPNEISFMASWVDSGFEHGESDKEACEVDEFLQEQEYSVLSYLVQKLGGSMVKQNYDEQCRSLRFSMPCAFETPQQQGQDGLPEPSFDDAAFSPDAMLESFSSTTMAHFFGAPVGDAGLEYLKALTLSDGLPEIEAENQTGALQILLVEDDPQSRLLFSLFLRDSPHYIVEALDGLEALDLYRKQHFDVVFMDMRMPNLDGLQTIQVMRALEVDAGRPPVPIVVVTSHASPGLQAQCMSEGCMSFLSKPYSRNSLQNLIDTVVRNISPAQK